MLKRILVATDRSDTASQAVRWAADMAGRFQAELLVLEVVAPANGADPPGAQPARPGQPVRAAGRESADALPPGIVDELQRHTQALLDDNGFRPLAVAGDDPADAIVATAEREGVDVIVVGNVGMHDRTKFLLANVPNRVSHRARCSVVIVNATELVGDGSGPPRPAGRTHVPQGDGHRADDADQNLLGRARHIAAVMAKFGVRHLLASSRPIDEETTRDEARRLRAALEELGPTFAKLGQILSTRPDLLPPAFVEELASLQDHVPPLSEAEVVAVMEQELGVPWEDAFETIDPAPLAAGTIAQVHRATITGGERVVAKVQRPTAERDILRDLALLERFVAKALDRAALRQVVDVPAIIEHLSTSLRRELDFQSEATNAERLKEVLGPFPRLDVPRVHRELSTRRLLVMDEVQGVPIRQAPEGPARREAGRQLLESYYRQILTDGFFHADPHPGNLLWCDDVVWFLDCGMVGELRPDVRDLVTLLLMAFWQEDEAFLAEAVTMLSADTVAGGGRAGHAARVDVDLKGLTEELGRVVDAYRHSSLEDLQLGPILHEIIDIAMRHHVRLPASLVLTAKALAQVQLVTSELDPTLDPFAVAGSYLAKSVLGRLRGGLEPRRLLYEAEKAKVRFTRLVESVERMSGARPGARLQVHFRGTERLEETVRRAGRDVAIALAAAGALVGAAVTGSSAHVRRWVPTVLGGTGGVLTTGLVAGLVRSRRSPAGR